MVDPRFAGEGFVYYEVKTSPDGSMQLLYGYSGGEKSATLIEPRVVSTATREIIFDLWHTYQNYQLEFSDNGNAVLNVTNHNNGRTRIVDINFQNSTFAFRDEPTVRRALNKLEESVSLFDIK